MMGRDLDVTEQKAALLEQLLSMANWGMVRLQQYVLFLPKVSVGLPDKAAVEYGKEAKLLPLRLQMRLI